MLIVGLTGGIGSGKSSVANLFTQLGAPVIDADVVAHAITEPHQPAFTEIVKHFGEQVLAANGTLDRAQLRQIIFTDPKERTWLENLLHPLIRNAMEKQIQTLTAPYCIAVIPLLLEVESYSHVNRILVVDTPEAMQIARVAARDNISADQIKAILNSQAKRQNRLARAQDIIHNDSTLADLAPQVQYLHEKYTKMGLTKPQEN